MAKEGDLWDDSGLINAFDNAMSKYKSMHGQKNSNASKGVEVVDEQEKGFSSPGQEDHVTMREEPKHAVASNCAEVPGEANNDPSVNGNPCVDVLAQGSHPDLSNGVPVQDTLEAHSYSQYAEGYDQLLAEYYELEQKREKVLQQLHQYGYWNYQFPQDATGAAPSAPWTTATAAVEPSVPSGHSCPVGSSCCPYVCQSFEAPCPVSTCSFGKTCVGQVCNGTPSTTHQKVPVEDSDITRTAIEAAEKALSSLKIGRSTGEEGGSGYFSDKEKKLEGETLQTESSGTDLSVVLNAWYSAGFYTGKYLVERSDREKRHS
ncbi:hypothetical protein EUGRSUZ_E00229 [Eucalyptus grandis]|uniref:Uncharacterized protein n=2 Tax=Eucalyptus grandis TaxID=71139 RepID=A0ACC3KRW2_EUCGR|nr:hypothetical protein EUGRSUZ_E00229 [Eucalyptus grandis]